MEKSCAFITLLFFCALVPRDGTCRKHRHHVKSSDGKIVGGYNTTIQDIAYQVYLLLQKGSDYYQCGGSIISPNYVLTAAHCLTGVSRIFIRAGSTDSDSGGTVYTTSIYRQHPQYNPATSDYDVGVINVPNNITLDGTNTRAVQLANQGTTIQPGTNILVSGWGTTSENGQTSENLMAVQVPTVSNTQCRMTYSYLTSRMFCAGVPQGGKDSCQGDSGGPAVSTDSGNQLGIVSFGNGCARPNNPGVYTNVPSVRNWIRLNTGV